jgi:hypothetical protein
MMDKGKYFFTRLTPIYLCTPFVLSRSGGIFCADSVLCGSYTKKIFDVEIALVSITEHAARRKSPEGAHGSFSLLKLYKCTRQQN